MPGGEIAHRQPVYGLAQLAADERQQQAEGVAIAAAGVPGQIAFGDDMFAQEAPEPRAEGYEFRHSRLHPHSAQNAAMPAAEAPGVIDR